jgi:hypothetical protein
MPQPTTKPFPWELWIVAISRSLRWLIAYEPSSGEATGGNVKVTVTPPSTEES